MRFRLRAALVPAALLAAAAVFVPAADRSGSDGKKATPVAPAAPAAARKAPQNSCSTCLERRPILDPALFRDRSLYEPDAAAAYEVARRIPATLDRLHCFCECAESARFHHKTLLTCFTDSHAAGCGICVKEALLAGELKQKGAPDDEIASLVHGMFRTEGHPPVPTRPASAR
ncbi:MAG TPA: PCYCGC motif-containing (lipo)protein [Thermoanaerobaculia bacterium]|jgi:hypothetical protein